MEEKDEKKKGRFRLFKLVLLLFLVLSILIVLIYYPYLYHELRYKLTTANSDANIILQEDSVQELEDIDFSKPILISSDSKYALIIPKIGANSRVIELGENISVDNAVFQEPNSPLPTHQGNTIINTHVSDGLLINTQLNPIYFLLNKLTIGDVFYIVYDGDILRFRINNIHKTKPGMLIEDQSNDRKTLIIRSPWPVGFQYKTLNIQGELESIE